MSWHIKYSSSALNHGQRQQTSSFCTTVNHNACQQNGVKLNSDLSGGHASDLRHVADWKVSRVDDVVPLHLTLPPICVGVVGNGYHFSTADLQLTLTSRLEVVVYVNLRLKIHNPRIVDLTRWSVANVVLIDHLYFLCNYQDYCWFQQKLPVILHFQVPEKVSYSDNFCNIYLFIWLIMQSNVASSLMRMARNGDSFEK